MKIAEAIRATLACLAVAGLAAGCGSKEAQNETEDVTDASTSATAVADNAGMNDSGQAFLATNGARDGVTTTASGLQYEVMVSGDGAMPGLTDLATVHYTGTLLARILHE